jgi:hypothetical protein
MRLTSREKGVLGLGILVGMGLLAYKLVVTPYIEKMRVLDRRIVQKTVELKEIAKLRREYLEVKERMEQFKGKARQRGRGFSLFSHLESLANKTKIKGNIASMKPRSSTVGEQYKESSVEVKLENVNTQQLVNYLFRIENSEAFLRIKRLHLKKRHDNPKYLDATFLISTYETTEGT